MPELSLVIPFYNEAANLPAVPAALARALDDAGVDYELIAVDNGSWDGTAAALQALAAENPRVRVVSVARNQGYGWGVLSGLREARGEHVGFMGGDGQIDPADVVRTWELMARTGPDLAKVCRVVRRDGWRRQLVTFLANAIFPLFFPVRTRDVNGTPKILRADLARALDLTSKDWFIDAEVMIKLGYRQARIGEVPVTFQAREKGASNVRWTTILEFLLNIWRFRRRVLAPGRTVPTEGRGVSA